MGYSRSPGANTGEDHITYPCAMLTIYRYDTKITSHRKDFLCHEGYFIIAHQLRYRRAIRTKSQWFLRMKVSHKQLACFNTILGDQTKHKMSHWFIFAALLEIIGRPSVPVTPVFCYLQSPGLVKHNSSFSIRTCRTNAGRGLIHALALDNHCSPRYNMRNVEYVTIVR